MIRNSFTYPTTLFNYVHLSKDFHNIVQCTMLYIASTNKVRMLISILKSFSSWKILDRVLILICIRHSQQQKPFLLSYLRSISPSLYSLHYIIFLCRQSRPTRKIGRRESGQPRSQASDIQHNSRFIIMFTTQLRSGSAETSLYSLLSMQIFETFFTDLI